MIRKFEIKDNDISDGYHTFHELYEHRKLLYILLCLHHTEDCLWADHKEFESIVLIWNSPFGQLSYHVSYYLKPLIDGKIREVTFGEHGWDGHSSDDVLHRLLFAARSFTKEKFISYNR